MIVWENKTFIYSTQNEKKESVVTIYSKVGYTWCLFRRTAVGTRLSEFHMIRRYWRRYLQTLQSPLFKIGDLYTNLVATQCAVETVRFQSHQWFLTCVYLGLQNARVNPKVIQRCGRRVKPTATFLFQVIFALYNINIAAAAKDQHVLHDVTYSVYLNSPIRDSGSCALGERILKLIKIYVTLCSWNKINSNKCSTRYYTRITP